MHCLYNYKIKSAVIISQLCGWIKLRRNDEYMKYEERVTTSSDGFNRHLMVPSEIFISCSLSGGHGFARQSSKDCVKGFMSFKRRVK